MLTFRLPSILLFYVKQVFEKRIVGYELCDGRLIKFYLSAGRLMVDHKPDKLVVIVRFYLGAYSILIVRIPLEYKGEKNGT